MTSKADIVTAAGAIQWIDRTAFLKAMKNVMAENGYMSNSWELNRIADNEIMAQKAKALVQGIVNYYLELSGYEVTYEVE